MASSGSWLNEKGQDKRKCPAHNFWMRKGQCELCRMRLDEIQRQNELAGGSNKPKVVIKKI
jgi:hypothetical protein